MYMFVCTYIYILYIYTNIYIYTYTYSSPRGALHGDPRTFSNRKRRPRVLERSRFSS
jgi:hypothetical protein